ncbi:MAG: dephospho-CoA kinase, partial [Deltaproteobacteria bacterium]|nr:dephospho-CoA kinase [Deltaproteobacteria bacterium]
GIATGKSTAARFFVEAGARLVDADQLARDAVRPGSPALEEIREAFGPAVLRADGTLDREALGARVFADEEARRKLNAIVHPRVAEAGRAAVEALRAEDPEALVVYDVPLLYETGVGDRFEAVVVVYAPRAEQKRRLMQRDGLAAEAAEARIASQMDIEEKARRADHVVRNTGSVEELREAVRRLVRTLREEPGTDRS